MAKKDLIRERDDQPTEAKALGRDSSQKMLEIVVQPEGKAACPGVHS